MEQTEPTQLAMTARLVAAMRATESQRPDRLVEDSLAAALAGVEGFAWLDEVERMQAPSGREPASFIPIRTRFFDDFLIECTRTGGVQQVVLVAAGMDSRAFRLEWPAGTRLFELDQAAPLAEKQAVLHEQGAAPNCERITLGCDLAEPWFGKLVDAGFRADELSAWLVEGLLVYLEAPAVEELLATISGLAVAGSRLGADISGESLLRSPWMQDYLKWLADRGVPWKFGTDEPEELFARHGWTADAAQLGGPEASYGRWPYPSMPRGIPGVPRSYFVRATRM